MNGSGRMNLRLADSYREDDHRHATDRRRRQAAMPAAPGAGAGSRRPAGVARRVTLAAIRRLVPHFV
jgi:hypothetical protein